MDSKKLPKGFVTCEKQTYHAQLLANRVKKRFAHLHKRFKRQNIDCFRLYDWDIPEVRAVVDWYQGHVVVAEYERIQTQDDWLPEMAQAVAAALKISPQNTHIKKRRTKTQQGARYEKLDSKGKRFEVNERDLKFWVNLDDFLDTGLFSDHRDTRVMVRDLAKDQLFLNLFAYTGSFSVAAAKGGAKKTVTVDRSDTYLSWAKDNFDLNELPESKHQIIQKDVLKYLEQIARSKQRFSLAFVDPPSFFGDQQKNVEFDINRDHPRLLESVLKVMIPGSTVIFSTNHQRFEPQMDRLPVDHLKEITAQTIPEDYRNQTVHRCWTMIVQ